MVIVVQGLQVAVAVAVHHCTTTVMMMAVGTARGNDRRGRTAGTAVIANWSNFPHQQIFNNPDLTATYHHYCT